MNIKEIKELLKLVNDTALTEVCIENEGFKLVIKKGALQTVVHQPMPHAVPAQAYQLAAVATAASAQAVRAEEADEDEIMIVSPMVGTFYKAPAPGAAPFVDVGSVVSQGQPVCIIEAMKLMNEIESEMSGRIVKVLVEDAQPVEYGQPLFVLEKV